jgi:hypothetical protein
MPSDYELRLRKLVNTDETVVVPQAVQAGQDRNVMGITSPNKYEKLDKDKHRKKNSDKDIVWNVHGDPDDVFDMIIYWRSHGNIEVTLVKETKYG